MEYKIPLFDLNFDSKERKAVLETIRSGWISTGPKVSDFESRFSEYIGSDFSLAATNCTVALHLAMLICGITEGDEVICPSLTFVATVNSIRYAGGVPVFADIKSSDDLNIDPDDIESKITSRTKAIIVMHYGGFPCDMKRISSIAKKNNLKLIEDSCHALATDYNGRKLGTIGDIGCFSFFSNKNMSTGEGGMLVTNNEEYYKRARLLRSHGMTTLSYERAKGHAVSYDVIDLGYNYRMDDIRASIGIEQLKKLEKSLRRRARIRNEYIKRLSGLEQIIIPFSESKGKVSNYIFPVILKPGCSSRRDEIRNIMKDSGIQTSIHYDPPVHKMKIYDNGSKLPLTEQVSKSLISLPMYPRLKSEHIKFIAESLKNAFIG